MIEIGEYKFDEVRHVHTLRGKPLTGVTTVIRLLSKGDALLQWAVNLAVEAMKKSPEKAEEALVAWKTKRDSAGRWGTLVHRSIEEWIKTGKEAKLKGTKGRAFKNFQEWAKDKKFIESEKNVWNEEWWIGGIVDLVYEFEGKRYIGDIKTSSRIYPENFFQMGAYHKCLGGEIEGYTVINLTKKGEMNVESTYDTKGNIEAFEALLKVYRKLEENKKII